ncbi:MAG: hypothetical protein AB2L07_05745 [Thermoanaerobaculaceae bacterium]
MGASGSYVTQDGRLSSVTLTTNPLHQVIARRRQIGGVAELTTYTWTPDGALRTSQGPEGTTTLLHDWRDRLVEAHTPAAVTAELVLDPLGRLVARRTTTPAGTLHRAYLHDGDQVVEEYASAPGHTGVRLARRHHWGRWIDDLVAEQVDTDGDGTLETTLYPVTDLLGSVELLTDEDGRIVERIAYDPDGTPRFWGEDTTRPRVTQLAWTGGGQSPAGVTVAASTLVLRFSEAIHAATMAGLSLTLTPDPGSRTQALDGDGRTLTVTFEQPIPATTPTALHLEGLADRTGNTILPFETTFTLADSQAYAVLADTAAPRIEAVIDTQSGLVLTFDEPVQPPQGTPLAGAVTITRSGLPVSGTTSRLTETALAWTPTEPASWQPGGEYRVTALTLQDLHSQPNPVQTASLPLTITHLATQPADAILAYTAPTDSVQLAASQYGQTALFQGREWHADLGMYYYRARWMLPGTTVATRDPLGQAFSPNLYAALASQPSGVTDPSGMAVTCSQPDNPACRMPLRTPEWANRYFGGPRRLYLFDQFPAGVQWFAHESTREPFSTPDWAELLRTAPRSVLVVRFTADDVNWPNFVSAMTDPQALGVVYLGHSTSLQRDPTNWLGIAVEPLYEFPSDFGANPRFIYTYGTLLEFPPAPRGAGVAVFACGSADYVRRWPMTYSAVAVGIDSGRNRVTQSNTLAHAAHAFASSLLDGDPYYFATARANAAMTPHSAGFQWARVGGDEDDRVLVVSP